LLNDLFTLNHLGVRTAFGAFLESQIKSPAVQNCSVYLHTRGIKVKSIVEHRVCNHLENPPPELFPDGLGRRFLIRIRNHLVQARNKVHIFDLDKLTLHDESRADEQERGQHQREVICDKGGRVPVVTKEDGEPAEDEDHDDHDESVPRRVGLEGGSVREEVSVETLSAPAGSESDIGDADSEPR